ncbi:hypothetical protein [Tepidimonas sp.]|uniref:hypothetical protein n=1 Tax=Tepidimonas sp. TaxID=2002775 RepID=UPI00391D599E
MYGFRGPNQALISKGLRPALSALSALSACPNQALISKGLRPTNRSRSARRASGPNQALISKGLRPPGLGRYPVALQSEPSPDFKGIKTDRTMTDRTQYLVRTKP